MTALSVEASGQMHGGNAVFLQGRWRWIMVRNFPRVVAVLSAAVSAAEVGVRKRVGKVEEMRERAVECSCSPRQLGSVLPLD